MLERLQKHLAMLRRRGLISEWYERDIEAGANGVKRSHANSKKRT
jgi:hypothetical protein